MKGEKNSERYVK